MLGTNTSEHNPTVKAVGFDDKMLHVTLNDGRIISAPLSWFPRLLNADKKALSNWESCAGGHGIHWTEIDEDLSVAGLLRGQPSVEARKM